MLRQTAACLEFMLNQVPILLAEDDRNDVFLIQRAFALAEIPNPLMVVNNGCEAIEYLAGRGIFAERMKYPIPGLLLLDLKMPWMDGFDVLSWLRRQRHFTTLPVVILTSSKLQAALDQSTERALYDFRPKPQKIEELVSLLADIRNRWLNEQFNSFAALLGMPTVKKLKHTSDPHPGNSSSEQ